MYDSFSEGGVYYGRMLTALVAIIGIAALLQAI